MKNINKTETFDKNLNKDFSSDWMLGSSPSMTEGRDISLSPLDSDTSTLSSSCLTRRSSVKTVYMPQAFRIAQSGRSMVEMLGVLAVIGVLSIGGIMGYSYGMDKYRANETINDVNLRSMDIIAQLTQGVEPTLASWAATTSSGYPISLNSDYAPMNYYIKVENVPFEVCDIISDTMPEAVDIVVNNGDEKCAAGLNAMEFSFEGFKEGAPALTRTDDECDADTDCTECQVCQGGYCANLTDNTVCSDGYCERGLCMQEGNVEFTLPYSCTTVSDCGGDEGCVACSTEYCNRWEYNGQTCTKNGETGKCYEGSCNIGSCSTNNDCKTDQYCGDTNASCTEANPSMCRELDFRKYPITYTDEDGSKQSETWYVSNHVMSWWDAKNACDALGKSMVSDPSEFVLDWDNQYGSYTKNKRWEALSAAMGTWAYVWTEKLTDNACYAFYMGADGYVDNNYRGNYYIAVCR